MRLSPTKQERMNRTVNRWALSVGAFLFSLCLLAMLMGSGMAMVHLITIPVSVGTVIKVVGDQVVSLLIWAEKED